MKIFRFLSFVVVLAMASCTMNKAGMMNSSYGGMFPDSAEIHISERGSNLSPMPDMGLDKTQNHDSVNSGTIACCYLPESLTAIAGSKAPFSGRNISEGLQKTPKKQLAKKSNEQSKGFLIAGIVLLIFGLASFFFANAFLSVFICLIAGVLIAGGFLGGTEAMGILIGVLIPLLVVAAVLAVI